MSDPLPPSDDPAILEEKPAAALAAARISVTVSMTASVRAVFAYTAVRCPTCNRLLIEVPGRVVTYARSVNRGAYSGQGAVVSCARCRHLVEVIAQSAPDPSRP